MVMCSCQYLVLFGNDNLLNGNSIRFCVDEEKKNLKKVRSASEPSAASC